MLCLVEREIHEGDKETQDSGRPHLHITGFWSSTPAHPKAPPSSEAAAQWARSMLRSQEAECHPTVQPSLWHRKGANGSIGSHRKASEYTRSCRNVSVGIDTASVIPTVSCAPCGIPMCYPSPSLTHHPHPHPIPVATSGRKSTITMGNENTKIHRMKRMSCRRQGEGCFGTLVKDTGRIHLLKTQLGLHTC